MCMCIEEGERLRAGGYQPVERACVDVFRQSVVVASLAGHTSRGVSRLDGRPSPPTKRQGLLQKEACGVVSEDQYNRGEASGDNLDKR